MLIKVYTQELYRTYRTRTVLTARFDYIDRLGLGCLRLMSQSQASLLAVCWVKVHSSTSYEIRLPLDNFC